MDGKVCLMPDLARLVLLFRVYCLPTRWFSCTQLPYLGRERRRQTNSWLKLRWLQSHQESTHSAPRGQIFRHFYLFKTREQFILSVHSFFLKEHTKSLHLFILILLSTHKTEKSAVNGQIMICNLEAKKKKIQLISLKNGLKSRGAPMYKGYGLFTLWAIGW